MASPERQPPGLTNTTSFNFTAGNGGVLVISAGRSLTLALLLFLVPFYTRFRSYDVQASRSCYEPLQNPFLENLKGCSSLMPPRYVTTWS